MTSLELLNYIATERAGLAHCYPLPSALDCIRYALTELGEYEDAHLRMERTTDKRNNDKRADWQSELGQCGEMIGASLVQVDGWRGALAEIYTFAQNIRICAVADLAIAIAEAMYPVDIPDVADAFGAWLDLVAFHQLDPLLLLAARYDQVRERHCAEAA
jgi:hypothetical protein